MNELFRKHLLTKLVEFCTNHENFTNREIYKHREFDENDRINFTIIRHERICLHSVK